MPCCFPKKLTDGGPFRDEAPFHNVARSRDVFDDEDPFRDENPAQNVIWFEGLAPFEIPELPRRGEHICLFVIVHRFTMPFNYEMKHRSFIQLCNFSNSTTN
jgi:hypothetical protein